MEGAEVTWIGHASAMVGLGGKRVLIDPLGRRRCRAAGPCDAVLVTHAHVDHLNRWTLASLDKGVPLFVPRGARPIVADLGFASVTEVEPGDHHAVAGLDIIGVPTRHDSGRWRKGDAPGCTGFVIARDGLAVHHSGDIDMSTYEVFEDIGRQFRIDAALLPIGGMLPVWYYRWRREALDRGVHIDPDTALEIAQILGARAMIPVHWGTLHLRLGPPSAPRRRLLQMAERAGVSHLVRVLGHGESLSLPPEMPPEMPPAVPGVPGPPGVPGQPSQIPVDGRPPAPTRAAVEASASAASETAGSEGDSRGPAGSGRPALAAD